MKLPEIVFDPVFTAVTMPGLLTGIFGIAGCVICLLLLRRRRIAAERSHAELRHELHAMLREQQTEYSGTIGQIGRNVALLESSAQNTEAATIGLTGSMRAEAMRLLRSGAPPETIGTKLGIGKRELRLIAEVSRTLAPAADHQSK